jgi:hypothetical protein
MSGFFANWVLHRLLAGLAALTLAVLNPASCLIHCAMMDARHEAAYLAFFLCDHGEPNALHQAELPPTQMPRAFYEVLASPATLVPLTLVLLVILVPRPTPQPLFVPTRPPTPPPRRSHRPPGSSNPCRASRIRARPGA